MIRSEVIGNWKMNLDHVEGIHLTQQIGVLLRANPHDHVDVVLAPPAIDLRSVSSVVEADRLPLLLAGQHVSEFDRGAYTGEISVSMYKRLGVTSILVGHSERRAFFAMTDEVVAATALTVLRGGLRPVICVGESAEVRSAEQHEEFVAEQVATATATIGQQNFALAYEPVWAIGTGETASVEQVARMAAVIREALPETARATTPILYGGSVKPENTHELASGGNVNGFLVGGASLVAEQFVEIVSTASDCYGRSR